MEQVSANLQSYIEQNSRSFTAEIKINNVVQDLHILKFTIHGGSNSENDFSIGSCVSQYLEMDVAKNTTAMFLQDKTFELYLKHGTDSILMGVFTAEKPESDERTTHIVAYDNMMKLERPVTWGNVGSTATVTAMLNAITNSTGVWIDTTTISDITMTRPDGYTCRETLSYIAQMYGGFAVCKRNGRIRIGRYVDSGLTITPSRYWDSFKHNDYNYVLEKITCYTGEDDDRNPISVVVGSGDGGIYISNPFMTQSRLNTIWSAIQNYTYMPGSVKILGDPRIDPWDTVSVVDLNGTAYKVPCMTLDLDYDGGLTNTIEAVGASDTEEETGFKSPNTRRMDRYYGDLVIMQRAMIDKLDADEADIRYASITNLNAVNARIDTLTSRQGAFENLTTENFSAVNADIQSIRTTDLTATNARVSVLEADTADIQTLLSGNAIVGSEQVINLTAQNVTFDTAFLRQLIASNITVGDLLASDVITDRFKVRSADSALVIDGSTLSIKDGDGIVRMQLGKDANGDFTFVILDETGTGTLYDSDGIHAGAIADGLLVDRMVANNANIQGSKLDIVSVINEVNGSTSYISDSRIWLDDDNQTLHQAYTSMTTSIEGAIEKSNQAVTQAQSALDALSGITTLDALSIVLSNDAHVVHTNNDGTGGDYSDCNTKVTVLLGDSDITDQSGRIIINPSEGVSGSFNDTTNTYQLTDMTTDNGYVDFTVGVNVNGRTLTINDQVIVMSNSSIALDVGDFTLNKRFSISKAPDGRTGINYRLDVSADAVIRKEDENGTLEINPTALRANCSLIDNGDITPYSGYWIIKHSTDRTNYTTAYESQNPEPMVSYTVLDSDRSIRFTIYDENHGFIDEQTVPVLTDAEGIPAIVDQLSDDVALIQPVVSTTTTRVTNIETSIDGINAQMSQQDTTISGMQSTIETNTSNITALQNENDIVWNTTRYDSGNNTTVYAHLYNHGTEITQTYPATYFSWKMKTENGDTNLGTGYSKTVDVTTAGFYGIVIWTFDDTQSVSEGSDNA